MCSDINHWLQQALARVAAAEADALASRGVFHIVLAGGSTPKRLYEALAQEPHDWARWQIWLGDERCLPSDHAERNSVMALASLPTQAAANFHPIAGERGPEQAAADYARQLTRVAQFDLVLLGLGEDGHTASLFPGHDWGMDTDAAAVLPVFNAPKPPPQRVSLSARRLSLASHVLFLVNGASKQAAIARWLENTRQPRSVDLALPAASIQPAHGVDVLMTRDAYPSGAIS